MHIGIVLTSLIESDVTFIFYNFFLSSGYKQNGVIKRWDHEVCDENSSNCRLLMNSRQFGEYFFIGKNICKINN